jgi:hypothetical protein
VLCIQEGWWHNDKLITWHPLWCSTVVWWQALCRNGKRNFKSLLIVWWFIWLWDTVSNHFWFRLIEFCFIIVTWIEPSDWAALSPMWWYSQCDIFKGFMINLTSKLCNYFGVLVSWPDVWCAMEHLQFMYREVWVRVVETGPILLLSSSWSHWNLVVFPTFCAWQENSGVRIVFSFFLLSSFSVAWAK